MKNQLKSGLALIGVTATIFVGPLAAAQAVSPAPPESLPAPIPRTSGAIATYTLVVPTSVSKSKLQTRAVIPYGSHCPKLTTLRPNGATKKTKMKLRSPGASTGAAFASIRVCSANIPRYSQAASVGRVKVPFKLASKIDKIALLADTGCRIKVSRSQNCSSPTDWPLATVAKSIAATKPDLAMMLGDFFYREERCPDSAVDQCGGSPAPLNGAPFKDSGYGWIADSLVPMAPLFATTPLLAVRGNHEACNRGGNGYFLLMDASPLGSKACAPKDGVAPTNITPSWAVDLPIKPGRTLRAISVDTAYGLDFEVTPWEPIQATAYTQAAKLAKRKKGRESWMLTHRPIFGLQSTDFAAGDPKFTPWGSADQEAAAQGKLGNFSAIMSSHVHVTQAVQLPGYPAQFVIGNGGTELEPPTGYGIPPYGPLLDGQGNRISPDFAPYPNANWQWTRVQFGFVVATPGKKPGQWTLSQRSPNGKAFATCSLKNRTARCK